MAFQGSHRPSVVFFNRVYPPDSGATGRLLRDLAQSFARDGWDVTVVTTGRRGNREIDGAVKVIRLGAFGSGRGFFSFLWVWTRMLAAGLAVGKPDLIVTMTDPPMFILAGRLVARLRKCRHIHWCQDLYPDILPALGVRLPRFMMQSLRTASRRAMKKCDRVVVIGRCMARHLIYGGMDARRVAVIPNWPDFELTGNGRSHPFPSSSVSPFPLKDGVARPYEALFRDTGQKFRILYAGNLGRAHPVRTILDAATLLASTNPEIEFVFVGEGRQFERLAQERARRGLENIRFLPRQPAERLKDLMESGDVHLISMREESAGLMVPCKLYSALAVGRPCILIGPDRSETARVIEDFATGQVIPQGQAERLAETIRTYRTDGAAWFAAHEGAAKAGKVFLPDESIRAWIERARDVVGIPHVIRRRAA